MKAFLIILVFLIFSILMILKKLPALLALPSMAVSIGIVAGIPFNEILNNIIGQGSQKLYGAIIATIFGAIFAQVINKTGISNGIIKNAAELSGDNPIILSIILTFAVAIIFTSVSGLGSVIMVGTIVLPIMISLGIQPLVAGILLILGLNLGGLFNVANFSFYNQVLNIDISIIKKFSLMFGITNTIIIFIYIFVNVPSKRTILNFSINTDSPVQEPTAKWFSLITPIIPIILIFIWPIIFNRGHIAPVQLNIVSAILFGIIYGIVSTRPKEIQKVLTSSFIEGIRDAAPAIALMIGIGILLQAVTNENISAILSPMLIKVLPSNRVTYVLLFFILSPLALYRGPLNMFGLGSGIAALMISVGTLSPFSIMGAMMAIGNVQGVCDPTNTHNVWISNYINQDTSCILKKSLPYVLCSVFINLLLSAIFFLK